MLEPENTILPSPGQREETRTLSRKKLLATVLFVAVISLGLVLAYNLGLLQRPILVSRNSPPRIYVEEPGYVFGTVEEGIQIPHLFKIQNMGGETLRITNVHTSCGCTVLNLASQQVSPGQSTDLQVTMDTSLKRGMINKIIEVTSNDPKTPLLKLSITANVLAKAKADKPPNDFSNPDASGNTPSTVLGSGLNLNGLNSNMAAGGNTGFSTDPHQGLDIQSATGKVGRSKLFTGRCAACHSVPAQGKKGKELFNAVCAMCHGIDGKGGEAPRLIGADFDNDTVLKYFLNTIRHGSNNNPSMAAFAESDGGPLSEADIQSIIDFLKQKSRESKTLSK